MFQVGVRRNNTKVMMAGRLKFAPLFYGLNKYNYQQIEILDSMMRLSAPPVAPLLILLAFFFTNCLQLKLHPCIETSV